MTKTTTRALAACLLLVASLSGCGRTKTTKENGIAARSAVPAQDCSSLQVTGVAPGQVAPAVSLRDGDGKLVNTHDFCNKTVLIVASSMF